MLWSISSDEIAAWADRVDASVKVPALIERLLLATASPSELELRTGQGVYFGGADALMRARDGGPFWPPGTSVWEFSVRGDVKRKLDEDYSERLKKMPPGLEPRLVTYVAVTARRFPVNKKEEWVASRRAQGSWADVRVLDADDLARWLLLAPAVRYWFAATELGRPVQDATSLDALLLDFAHRTKQPLPASIALTGERRQRAVGELVRALRALDDSIRTSPSRDAAPVPLLRVMADTREEGLIFIAAALSTPSHEAAPLKARTVIVESAAAFPALAQMQSAQPLVLVPNFTGASTMRTAGHRALIVLPVAPDDQLPPGEGLKLGALPARPLARALEAAGFTDAERWARESGGRLIKLQRLLGHVELPPWAQGSPAAELLALLLVGAWEPTREADREILRRLGADPDEAEKLCVRLSLADPAFEAVGEHFGRKVWRWVVPRDAWRALARNLTDTHMNRFFDVAVKTLSPLPPIIEEDRRAYIQATLEREQQACSGALFHGIAGSIAWLAVNDDALGTAHLPGRGSGLAAGLVRRLLAPDWNAWSSLAGVLRELAEAAPQAFLDQLRRSIEQGADGVGHLFSGERDSHRQKASFSAVGWGGPVELLWALEVLAWNRDLLPQVAESLASLVQYDGLPDNLATHPLHCLTELLHCSMPQSQSSAQERVAILRMLFQKPKLRDVAWQVSVEMLGALGIPRLVVPSQHPRYRPWAVEPAHRQVAPAERDEQVSAMVGMLLENVGADADRWASLVPLSIGYLRPRVLNALDAARPQIEDSKGALWGSLRREIRRLSSALDSDDDDEHEVDEDAAEEREARIATRKHLEALYESFRPADLVLQVAWLFAQNVTLPSPIPGGWEEEERRARELRLEAVAALRAGGGDGWAAIERLARAVEVPGLLAEALSRAPFAQEIEDGLLTQPPRLDLGAASSGFFVLRHSTKGWEWLQGVLSALLQQGRLEQAAGIAAHFLGPRIWEILRGLGEPLITLYWSKIRPQWMDLDGAELELGIDGLLGAGRPHAALEAASQQIEKISSQTVLRILDALRSSQDEGPGDRHMRGYHMERLFLALDRDPSVEVEHVVRLENDFFESLKDTERSARRFYEKLSSSPTHVLDVLRRLRSPHGDPMAALEEPKDAAGVERRRLYGMLYHWKGYPGEHDPVAEREAKLEQWCSEVLRLAAEEGLSSPACHEVAAVLARAEPPEDGHWPCLTARRLIDRGDVPRLRDELYSARRHGRGWVTRRLGEGGNQERALAAEYQAGADALRLTYPRTAAMLDELAAAHRREADAIEPIAERERLEYGEDEPSSRRRRVAEADHPRAPLRRIELSGVGPADDMTLDFSSRLNVLAGDNSAGKTFVLDVLWWALSGGWPGRAAWKSEMKGGAAITVHSGDHAARSEFDALNSQWSPVDKRLAPGLAVYARVDGGFSVWDPLRSAGPLVAGYRFTQDQLWNGLEMGGTTVCNGLIRDVADWFLRKNGEYSLLQQVLAELSPPGEAMRLGDTIQLPDDDKHYPTLLLSYGRVPVVHASAAVKRILSLAYVLVWAFQWHHRKATETGLPPAHFLTLLIDEVEAHLHPKWQRVVMPALLRAVEHLSRMLPVQVFLSTHAPLVLASLERLFDAEQDTLLHFGIEGRTVRVEPVRWTTHGDATNWLESNVFGLERARSTDAERAIAAALAFQRNEPRPGLDTAEKIEAELMKTLPGDDPFLLDWVLDHQRT